MLFRGRDDKGENNEETLEVLGVCDWGQLNLALCFSTPSALSF